MRVVVFFICMCFLLVGGYNYVCYAPVHDINKTHQVKFTDPRQNATDISSAKSTGATEYLIADEVEDEDTSNASARKYKLLGRYYIALSRTSFSSYLHSFFTDHHPPCSYLSCKYLLQRSLRI